jgi:hypothetical protein
MGRLRLELGDWRTVLSDVRCDLLCTDPPYSRRTHDGHDESPEMSADGADRQELGFAHWTPRDVDEFVDFWAPRTAGWMACMTDHVLSSAWESAMARHGRYVFSPLACIEPGSRVRIQGDGPAQWACWLVVSRPMTPEYAGWGALPGGYTVPKGCSDRDGSRIIGGKAQWLLDCIVRDYSRPGDVVCDPCAGRGTTLRAAMTQGRLAVGSEIKPDVYAKAHAYLHAPTQTQIVID